MGKNLNEIAQNLKDNNKKVQLIYAFNGSGKTRLSKKFKAIANTKSEIDDSDLDNRKVIYYNAFTEDLFYWDNDLENDVDLKLKIHPNAFTDWVFSEQGQEPNVVDHFQNYTNKALTPKFSPDFSEVTFSFKRGNDEDNINVKISKGEESNFVWSIFYSLLEQVVNVLNVPDPNDRETAKFNQLEYIFIDDPVTSLDDNHLIQMAVDLAEIVKKTESDLKFIITTHNPIFYNVLFSEINKKSCYMLENLEDGSFKLIEKNGDSNKSFSYHLHLKNILEEAIAKEQIQKYHFTLLRNLYEKTASFLGFPRWKEILPDNKENYYNRIIQFTSHSTLSNESVAEPTPQEKKTVKLLLEHLINNYSFWREE